MASQNQYVLYSVTFDNFNKISNFDTGGKITEFYFPAHFEGWEDWYSVDDLRSKWENFSRVIAVLSTDDQWKIHNVLRELKLKIENDLPFYDLAGIVKAFAPVPYVMFALEYFMGDDAPPMNIQTRIMRSIQSYKRLGRYEIKFGLKLIEPCLDWLRKLGYFVQVDPKNADCADVAWS